MLEPRATPGWMQLVLSWTNASSPVGSHWSDRNLKSMAASGANALRGRLAMVSAYIDQSSRATTARHYDNNRTMATEWAWMLHLRMNGSLAPSSRRGYVEPCVKAQVIAV